MRQGELALILLEQWASHMMMPIWVANQDEVLIFYNEAAEALLGLPFAEAGDMPLGALPTMFNLIADDGSPLSLDVFPLTLAHRKRRPSHGRVRYQALDGVSRRVDVTAFPITWRGGQDLGAVAMFWEAHEP
jgi:PAS domain-containing protein